MLAAFSFTSGALGGAGMLTLDAGGGGATGAWLGSAGGSLSFSMGGGGGMLAAWGKGGAAPAGAARGGGGAIVGGLGTLLILRISSKSFYWSLFMTCSLVSVLAGGGGIMSALNTWFTGLGGGGTICFWAGGGGATGSSVGTGGK